MKPSDHRLSLYRINSDEHERLAGHREANLRKLLRLLRRHSPVSRADLVRLSGLTAPTVSAGIAKLERRNLVIALGPGNSSGGRRPGLLEFNTRHGYVIGVDLGGSYVRLALADLNGTVIGKRNTALSADRTPEVVTATIGADVQQLLKQHKIAAKDVLEMCVGAPGITDVVAGRVLSAPNLTDWHDVPFRDLLQTETRIPATIENDVNLGALGESWRGAARGTANFVFLAVGTGVGAGIVVNNTLHHGATWSAGEVGYMLLPGLPAGPLTADDLGALESAVGGKSIQRTWAELVAGSGEETPSKAPPKATDIFDRAAAGDQIARKVLLLVAEQLAMAITNLNLVLDLSLVVLSGGVGEHPGLLEAVRRRLERNEFARPQLVMSSLGHEATIHGAIWLALRAAELAGFRRQPMGNRLESSKPLGLAGD